MRKLIFILIIVFPTISAKAQTDLDIVDSIIGTSFFELEERLSQMGVEFFINENTVGYSNGLSADVYIQKNNSIRLWDMHFSTIYNKKLKLTTRSAIKTIFIRYVNTNINDLKEFFAYEEPISTKQIKYDKEMGEKLSHFKITLK